MVTIDMCQNTTANGNKCKSKEEISTFGENNIFYFQRQDNVVDKDLYRNDVAGIKTLNSSEGDYFPIRVFQKSMFYRTLPKQKDYSVEIFEMPMTISTLEINDAYIRLDYFTRSKQFIEWTTPRFIDEIRDLLFATEKNKALYCFYIGLFPKATSNQRIDYDLLTLLGDVGGLTDALLTFLMALVVLITSFYVDLKVIDTFECLIDFDPSMPG